MSLTHLLKIMISDLHFTFLLPQPWSLQPTALWPTFYVKSHLPFKFLAALLCPSTRPFILLLTLLITDLSFCAFFQPFLPHLSLPLFTPITVYPFTTTHFLGVFPIQLIRIRVALHYLNTLLLQRVPVEAWLVNTFQITKTIRA